MANPSAPEPKWVQHPLINTARPNVVEDENPGLGRGDRVLAQQREEGLDDDPTASGEPVRNSMPFRNLRGGR